MEGSVLRSSAFVLLELLAFAAFEPPIGFKITAQPAYPPGLKKPTCS